MKVGIARSQWSHAIPICRLICKSTVLSIPVLKPSGSRWIGGWQRIRHCVQAPSFRRSIPASMRRLNVPRQPSQRHGPCSPRQGVDVMLPLAVSAMCIASSLGSGLESTLSALRNGTSGLQPCHFETVDLATCVGEVPGLDDWCLDQSLARFECRNNRLARLALAQDGFESAIEAAKARYGGARIGVFLGTSTSGILQIEQAYRRRTAAGQIPHGIDYAGTQSTFSVADFVMSLLGVAGPALVISSACASTTKVFATAARMIEMDLCDAAIVGGADSLCLTTLYGFNALQLLATEPCRPFDAARGGISIGEGAGFALLERPEAATDAAVLLLG